MIITGDYFQFLKPGVTRISDGKSRVYFSKFAEFYSDDIFRNFSIKLPLNGIVLFKTMHKEFYLKPGYFLLSQKQRGKAVVQSAVPVGCICIDIDIHIMRKAFESLKGRSVQDLNLITPDYFFSGDFFEHIYPVAGSALGKYLTDFAAALKKIPDVFTQVNEGFFIELAEMVILLELENVAAFRRLKSVKASTRREILHQMLQTRHFIDLHYLANPTIKEIAANCNVSGFHFFRIFRQTFGSTPYQYMLRKRLEHGLQLLQKGMPVHHVAQICSFNDPFSFSKAFKNKFGVSPAQAKKPCYSERKILQIEN